MIDSLHDPEAVASDEYNIARSMNLLPNCSTRDTTGHGTLVCRILNNWTDRVEINLYRVIQPGGSIRERHLINGIGYAHVRDNVDIINVSAGNDHSEDGNEGCARHNQPCKVRDAANKAVSDDIPVVAAAGNEDQFASVCCPSLQQNAISVGGFVSKCRFQPDTGPLSEPNSNFKPPLACWAPHDDQDYALCTGDGCIPHPDATCEEHCAIENWSGNVSPVWNKPDVLAPAATVIDGDKPFVSVATSWATPRVTAWVAEVMSGVRDRGQDPPAYVFRQALEETTKHTDTGDNLLFNADQAMLWVYDELDLPRPTRSRKSTFDSGSGAGT